MDTWVWVVIAIVAVIAIAAIAWAAMRKRRTAALREQFGPEYDRTLDRREDRKEAETELEGRRVRRQMLDIRPLDPAARRRYATQWSTLQARFVDEPVTAVADADGLVLTVMRERGYPMDDFEQRAADVSVDHPKVIENYRAGHAIAERVRSNRATTEDMRRAVVHYRALFAELLTETGSEDTRQAR